MKKDKIKVLQINAGSRNFGGVSVFIYNVYKNIDRNHIQFDFLSPNETTYETVEEDIEKMSGNIFELHIKSKRIYFYYELFFQIKKFLKNHNYDIIHINSGVLLFNIIVATAAKIAGQRRIIVHSHNAKIINNKLKIFIRKFLKKLLDFLATDYLACSMLAAESMFSNKLIKENKVKIIKNGIDINKFIFNDDIRQEYRKKLNIEDRFVIGHIGRFVEQKNHEFLIDIFNELLKINNNSILLLIGEGELERNIKQKVKEYNLEDHVKFLGIRKDIPSLMQTMDVFLLPSKYEGLPIVSIEAQAAGVKVLLSDNITKECKLTNNIEFLSLNSPPKIWANKILEMKRINNNRYDSFKNIQECGYTIKSTSQELEKIYIREE